MFLKAHHSNKFLPTLHPRLPTETQRGQDQLSRLIWSLLRITSPCPCSPPHLRSANRILPVHHRHRVPRDRSSKDLPRTWCHHCRLLTSRSWHFDRRLQIPSRLRGGWLPKLLAPLFRGEFSKEPEVGRSNQRDREKEGVHSWAAYPRVAISAGTRYYTHSWYQED